MSKRDDYGLTNDDHDTKWMEMNTRIFSIESFL